jgi:pimeloyl-ACP methyl ester carboxylesterase
VRVTNGDVELECEAWGDPSADLVVLIAGLGSQLVSWDEALIELFVDRDFYVVRFDNRDSGLSSSSQGLPDIVGLLDGTVPVNEVPYTLEDMADDVAAIIAAHDGPAHLVGVSMGGMIAQLTALRHPAMVRSLTSLMSSTGNPSVGQPSEVGVEALVSEAPTDRDGYVEHVLEHSRLLGSVAELRDEVSTRRKAERTFDRGLNPDGAARQLAAVVVAADRTEALAALSVPTFVMHGDIDPLINVDGSHAIAGAIRDSELMIIEGMGHDLPPPLWPVLVEGVVRVARRAYEQSSSGQVDGSAG